MRLVRLLLLLLLHRWTPPSCCVDSLLRLLLLLLPRVCGRIPERRCPVTERRTMRQGVLRLLLLLLLIRIGLILASSGLVVIRQVARSRLEEDLREGRRGVEKESFSPCVPTVRSPAVSRCGNLQRDLLQERFFVVPSW